MAEFFQFLHIIDTNYETCYISAEKVKGKPYRQLEGLNYTMVKMKGWKSKISNRICC